MLVNIINDKMFPECMGAVRDSISPYSKDDFNRIFRNKKKGRETIEKLVEKESGKLKVYKVFKDSVSVESKRIPFGEDYHRMFVTKGLANLAANKRFPAVSPAKVRNKSGNEGNYNHFLNVIAATARLIDYFSVLKNFEEVFIERKTPYSAGISCEYLTHKKERLIYRPAPNLRTFKLMLAAYYHDLGKTVVDHRHSREGYIILTDDSTEVIAQMKDIASCYDCTGNFDWDDIHFIATLVNFHDLFGTMSTGETGYLRVWNMIDRIKRYSLRNVQRGMAKQREWSERYLFDLWLLNVADIIVSISDEVTKEGKWVPQKVWMQQGSAIDKIERFFEVGPPRKGREKRYPSKADCLIHDLVLCFRLLDLHNTDHHAADTQQLRDACYTTSSRHVMDRLQRFLLEILWSYIAEKKKKKRKKFDKTIEAHILNGMTEEHLNAVIIRSINALHSSQGFNKNFAWIGQMDYALRFFQKILGRAVEKVEKELHGGERTGWIRSCSAAKASAANPDEMNALYFLYNFTSVVIQLIGFILNREAPLDRLRNLEFDDAGGDRLTENKLDRIISLQGPYRASRTQELILENVYIF